MRNTPGLVQCDECGTPALRVVGTTIVIEHRHHGERHVTVIALATLLEQAGLDKSPVIPAR